jgi:type II secretory pathway pseudopilin PulG
MKASLNRARSRSSVSRRACVAETVVEVMVGVSLLGLVFASLFSGMSMSTRLTQLAREDLRATQILLERMEGIRLFNWNQLVYSNTLCPPKFTCSYSPFDSSSGATGITYYGSTVITNVSFNPAASYSNQMRAIIVTVNWTNAGIPRTRTMMTYQAQYGEQNYTFNN